MHPGRIGNQRPRQPWWAGVDGQWMMARAARLTPMSTFPSALVRPPIGRISYANMATLLKTQTGLST